ncbi:MAG: succinate dehydrogenase cytochrome b subunit [Bacteroidetes bacterium]|nr:succinate dehydrogenase cytochrome b subunit [Bacteroidota bacterium]
MNSSFFRFSSITKKIWMAFLGLFLMIFLVVHLGINLCLLRDDGGAWFTAAAHFMGTNYIVKVFEIGLFAGFIIHILLGIILQVQNWMARPVRYMVSNKTDTPFLSKYMIYTGGIVLIFLVIHFINFYFIKLGWVSNPNVSADGEPEFYTIAQQLFANPVYSILYICLFIVLGFHLNQAFQAAWQTLGINHPQYTTCIRRFGTFYAIVVPLGFIIIPFYYLFIR